MTDAAYNEFPFVQDLPKREKSKLAKAWEQLQEYKAACEKHGCLLPQILCAEILGVSQQRIGQLIESGQLQGVGFARRTLVTEDSFMALCKQERKNGRPLKAPSLKDSFRIGLEIMK